MKYCANCGKPVKKNAKFCPYCGYRFQNTYDSITNLNVEDEYLYEKQSKKRNFIPIVAGLIAAAAVVLIILLIPRFNVGSSEESDRDNSRNVAEVWLDGAIDYENSKEKFARNLTELVPEEIVEKTLEESGYDTLPEMIDAAWEMNQTSLDFMYEYLPLRETDASYRITDQRPMNSTEIEELEDLYFDDGYDFKVEKAMVMDIHIYSYYDVPEFSGELKTIKVDGKWYIDYVSSSNITNGLSEKIIEIYM